MATCPIAGFGIPSGGLTYFDLQYNYEIFKNLAGDTKLYLKNLVLNRITETIKCRILDGKYLFIQTTFNNQIRALWYPKTNLSSNLPDLSVLTKVADYCTAGVPNPCSDYIHLTETITAYAKFTDETPADIWEQTTTVNPILYQESEWFEITPTRRSGFHPQVNATNWQTVNITYEVTEPMYCSTFLGSEKIVYNSQRKQIRHTQTIPSYDNTDYTDLEDIISAL
jgi:hypothetical protein